MCILNTNPTLIIIVLALKIDILLFVLLMTVDCYIIYYVLFERIIFFFSSEVSCPSSSLGMSLYLPLPQIHSILHYLIKPNPNCTISMAQLTYNYTTYYLLFIIIIISYIFTCQSSNGGLIPPDVKR